MPLPEFTADHLYERLRVEGKISLGEEWHHLVPRVQYRAKRDGLNFSRCIIRLGQRGRVGWDNYLIEMSLHDGRGNLVYPDRKEQQ